MLSSRHKLLFIKRMHLIGVAFYEPNLDRLESMWSPDIFGEMMAISCKKIEFQTNRQHSSSWAAAVNAKALDRSSQLALARAGLASIMCPNVCGHGYVPYKRISFIKRILSFCLPLLAHALINQSIRYSMRAGGNIGESFLLAKFPCIW